MLWYIITTIIVFSFLELQKLKILKKWKNLASNTDLECDEQQTAEYEAVIAAESAVRCTDQIRLIAPNSKWYWRKKNLRWWYFLTLNIEWKFLLKKVFFSDIAFTSWRCSIPCAFRLITAPMGVLRTISVCWETSWRLTGPLRRRRAKVNCELGKK